MVEAADAVLVMEILLFGLFSFCAAAAVETSSAAAKAAAKAVDATLFFGF